jgi:hypothetical protein
MATEPLFDLKFNFLSFPKATEVHPSEFGAMEEKVWSLRSLDKAKSSVRC